MVRVSVLMALVVGGVLSAAPAPKQFHLPLTFEKNQGQFPAQVKWVARTSGYEVLFNDQSATIVIPGKAALQAALSRLPAKPRSPHIPYNAVRMKLAGSGPWQKISGAEPTGGVANYVNARNLKASVNGVPQYRRMKVANVYPGIDLMLYSNGGDLEYDFSLAPDADPREIQMVFEGAKAIRVDFKTGDLVLALPDGSELRQLKPRLYQRGSDKNVEILGGYKLLDRHRVAFTVADYDRSQRLMIDPRLTIARSISGSKDTQANAVAVDDHGNTFITGSTLSLNLPVTNDSQFLHPHDCGIDFCATDVQTNAFVAEVASDGSIPFVTYAGVGSGNGIAVDSSGVYITGEAVEPESDIDNFPFQNNVHGELFVAKVALNGQPGYIAFGDEPGTDLGNGIALDDLHNAWATGVTYEDGTAPPHHMLLIEVAPDGKKIYKRRFESSGNDSGNAIAIADRQPWITGQTCGDGFPTTDGIVHHLDHCAVFVLRLSEAGNETMGMVFGGVDGDDAGVGIVMNGGNAAFVTGYSNSLLFPHTTLNLFTAHQWSLPMGFVTEVTTLNGSAGTIVRSALFNAFAGSVTPFAIANDNRGGLYVAGATSSLSFPRATSPGLPTAPNGFVAKFSADFSQFEYSVMLGRTLTGVALRGPSPVFAPEASCGQCFPEIYVSGWDDSTFNDPGSPHAAQMVKMVDDTPTSFVTNTAGQLNVNPFTVSWGGSSPLSSVVGFDVFVSDNGGPFTAFLTGTTATSAPFTGVPGHTYGFFSIATDASGAKEPIKTKADVTITIADVTPPVITPQIAGALGNNGWYRSAVTVNWTVADPESGIVSSTGCAPINLTTDTAGLTLTCLATNGVGLTTSVPITIKIDKTPPFISGMPVLQCSVPNHPIMQVDTVTATDAGSGLVANSFTLNLTRNDPSTHSFPPQIVIAPNGSGGFTVLQANRLATGNGPLFSLTATALDQAGNSASAIATCGGSR